jgi:3-dehydroquinate synthase
MNSQLSLHFSQSECSYPIFIGEKLLKHSHFIHYCQSLRKRGAIISDSQVAPLYGQELQMRLQFGHVETSLLVFEAGEKQKTRQTKEWLEDQLFEQGFGRDSFLIALGGGVVTDLSGFLASTYCRGIPLIMIPTSLLAMVDASIGGKTAVNVPYGKNMVGTLYHPSAIFMDTSTLKTLSKEEFKNGVVEAIKHGLILDASYFAFLEQHAQNILNLEMSYVERLIYESCLIKRSIVEEDEQEKGKRRTLNFGHTLGHAIELLTDYQIPHGQAVAVGILGESYLSMQLGLLSSSSFERIRNIFKQYQIEIQNTFSLSPARVLNALQLDKKSVKNQPRFVLLKEIGTCTDCSGEFCSSVEQKVLEKALNWICRFLN